MNREILESIYERIKTPYKHDATFRFTVKNLA